MGVHDVTFGYLGNTWPERLAGALIRRRRPSVEPLPREVSHIKLAADFAVIVEAPGPRRVLHAEHVKQRAHLARVVARHALYHDLTGLPVDTVIVATSRVTARPIPAVYRFGLPGRRTAVPLRRVRLWERSAEAVLAARRIELYPFLLAMERRMDAEALLRLGRRRILTDVEPGQQDQALAAFWLVSEELVGKSLVEGVLGRLGDMAKTTLGQRLIEQGRAEGREEGRRDEAVASLLAILRARFGPIPKALEKELRSLPEIERLETLIPRAATVESLAAFRGSSSAT